MADETPVDEIMRLEAEIEALRGALRGVRDRYVIQGDAEKCAAEMDVIARKALCAGDKDG